MNARRTRVEVGVFDNEADLALEYIHRVTRALHEALRERDDARKETETVRETNRQLREQIEKLKEQVGELTAELSNRRAVEAALATLSDERDDT